MIEAKKKGRRSRKPSEQELAMMYSQMTAKEVGERYGVAETTVRRWIREYRRNSINAEKN